MITRIQAPYSSRDQLLEILSLADSQESDDFGNEAYTFTNNGMSVSLKVSTYDGDVSVCLNIPEQKQPILNFTMLGTREIEVQCESNLKILHFIGALETNQSTRGNLRREIGIRVQIEPHINIVPYLINALV